MNQARQEGELFCSPHVVALVVHNSHLHCKVPHRKSLNEGLSPQDSKHKPAPSRANGEAGPPAGTWCWIGVAPQFAFLVLPTRFDTSPCREGDRLARGAGCEKGGCQQTLLFVWGDVTQC